MCGGQEMSRLRILKLTSCQAENSEFIGRAVAKYVTGRLGLATEFVNGIPWQERERLLDEGAIHAGWICGLPYVRKADALRPGVELLAAPVMEGDRYRGRPVYFSDVVVRRDSAARSFADLRGARWAYNEPGSHSGYNIVRYHLARLGERAGYFENVTETGAHQKTLRMIETGDADASAIDSTVLETEFRRSPALARALRVVETWGPSPAPPWVVSRRVSLALRRDLRRIMLSMHREPSGRSLLKQARMTRFVCVSDRDYDPIRRMARDAGDAAL
jgi:phosphonate transport system substrate-binding protein